MKGVFGTTISLVPETRPARPMPGCSFSNDTALTILNTTPAAACGSSRAMYSSTASRSRSALLSHLTRNLGLPLCQNLVMILKDCIRAVRFAQRVLNAPDLPFVYFKILFQRFFNDIGFRTAGGAGKTFESGAGIRLDPYGQACCFEHIDLHVRHLLTLCGKPVVRSM